MEFDGYFSERNWLLIEFIICIVSLFFVFLGVGVFWNKSCIVVFFVLIWIKFGFFVYDFGKVGYGVILGKLLVLIRYLLCVW